MDSDKQEKEKQQNFIDAYLWKLDSRFEYRNYGENSTVRPFLHQSNKFYWEKAYSAYLATQTTPDKVALAAAELADKPINKLIDKPIDIAAAMGKDFTSFEDKTVMAAEKIMDVAYTVGNAFNAAAPAIKQVAQVLPVVGITWNMIDVAGTVVLAVRDGKKQDTWAQRVNLLSSAQLTAGTVAFTLINYSGAWHIGITTSLGASVIATAASSFTFAAAMYFAWALEHREVKLHRARINALDSKILELEKYLFGDDNLSSSVESYMGDYPKTGGHTDKVKKEKAGEQIEFLKKLTVMASGHGSEMREYGDLLELLKFREHQQQQLVIHERARRAWGLCAIFMTAVAIVSAVFIALGFSAMTCGLAVAAISSATILCSALYRHNPEFFDNKAQTIKGKVMQCSFFKPLPNQSQAEEANIINPSIVAAPA